MLAHTDYSIYIEMAEACSNAAVKLAVLMLKQGHEGIICEHLTLSSLQSFLPKAQEQSQAKDSSATAEKEKEKEKEKEN